MRMRTQLSLDQLTTAAGSLDGIGVVPVILNRFRHWLFEVGVPL